MENYLISLGNWVNRFLAFGVCAVLSCSLVRLVWEKVTLGKWEKEHKAAVRELSREESCEE